MSSAVMPSMRIFMPLVKGRRVGARAHLAVDAVVLLSVRLVGSSITAVAAASKSSATSCDLAGQRFALAAGLHRDGEFRASTLVVAILPFLMSRIAMPE
jgi:hypothetical protein